MKSKSDWKERWLARSCHNLLLPSRSGTVAEIQKSKVEFMIDLREILYAPTYSAEHINHCSLKNIGVFSRNIDAYTIFLNLYLPIMQYQGRSFPCKEMSVLSCPLPLWLYALSFLLLWFVAWPGLWAPFGDYLSHLILLLALIWPFVFLSHSCWLVGCLFVWFVVFFSHILAFPFISHRLQEAIHIF